MFNKAKETSSSDSGASFAPPPKRTAMKSKAPSILSSDLVLTGSIVSDGEIQLDGQVDGDVRAGSLIIGEDASVSGEVSAETVVIRGKVTGSVRARQVQLASTARIEGDIVHATLSVEAGAYFDGHCRHASDPMQTGDASKSAKPKVEAPKADSKPPAPGKPDPLDSLEPPVAASKSGF
jgi:cytoskeletal protein CcmA (bactofilin family)